MCAMANGKRRFHTRRESVVRHTITLPADLVKFVEEQTNLPRHAGNRSSFIRELVIARKEQLEQLAACGL